MAAQSLSNSAGMQKAMNEKRLRTKMQRLTLRDQNEYDAATCPRVVITEYIYLAAVSPELFSCNW